VSNELVVSQGQEEKLVALVSTAHQAIEKAGTVAELKTIRDQAVSVIDYARVSGMSSEIINECVEIKIRSECKAGELLSKVEKDNKGGDRKSRSTPRTVITPYRQTLEEAGIKKQTGARWQAMHDVPEAERQKWFKQKKDAGEKITTTQFLKLTRKKPSVETPNKDAEILESYGIKIQPYDVWSFSSCHPSFGEPYPGRVPGQIVAHCLYFWTHKGEMVLDPMAGSGTTLDVCKAMQRKACCYDAMPHTSHIKKHDMLAKGWPENTAQAALIFWDPPYYKKKDEGYCGESISRLSHDEYLAFFGEMAESIPKTFAGRLALLVSDYNDEQNQEENIFYWDYVNLFVATGRWVVERRIQAPLGTQAVHPDIVRKFRAARRLARLNRDLVVLKHPVQWMSQELSRRGGPGDRAGVSPTPGVGEFLELLGDKKHLFTQDDFFAYCVNGNWRAWYGCQPEAQKKGVQAKVYNNFCVSMVDTIHVWALLVEAQRFDVCFLDAYEDVVGKSDLTLVAPGGKITHLALLGPRAKQDREYKLQHRAGPSAKRCIEVQLPYARAKGVGNKRWYCIEDFADVMGCDAHIEDGNNPGMVTATMRESDNWNGHLWEEANRRGESAPEKCLREAQEYSDNRQAKTRCKNCQRSEWSLDSDGLCYDCAKTDTNEPRINA
jgi:DNA modification methylase